MTRTRRSGSALALLALAALMVSSLAPVTGFAAKTKGAVSHDSLKTAKATTHGQIASQLRNTASKQLPPIELQVDDLWMQLQEPLQDRVAHRHGECFRTDS